ncbi:S-layer homology domain-containing protein [Paenibacillus hubeiensis]|uniref:S-layer homology domain-containing protein n=1 Tax=Paenibacillus hubeiensis TaxID=3077330 RepID=UPI0031BAABF1
MNLKKWGAITAITGMLFGLAAPAGYADPSLPYVLQETGAAEADRTAESTAAQGLQIVHTPAVATHASGQPLTLSAQISGGQTTVTASVYYRVDDQTPKEVVLTNMGGQEYAATIEGNQIVGGSLNYYFEAREGEGVPVRSSEYAVQITGQSQPDMSAPLDILITELVPDSDNVNSADAYEFVEVYNNSGRELDFADFRLRYNTNVEWPLTGSSQAVIPAGKAIVLWVMNGSNNHLTVDDFNRNYGTQLTEGSELFRIDGGGGMANGAGRTLEILAASGMTLVSASYQNDEQTQPNKGIFYRHPAAGSVDMIMMDGPGTLPATPGTVTKEQTEAPGEADPGLLIKHTPVTVADAAADLTIDASLEHAGAEPADSTVNLLYKTASQSKFTVVAMKPQGGVYAAAIPAEQLVEPSLDYRIQAVSGGKSVITDSYTVQIRNVPAFDPQKAPQLLVTEVVPNTTNVNGADGYEFVEIYNNSDQDIDFRNYKLYYRYTDKGPAADVIWSPDKQDFVIPSRQAVVFWIINSSIPHLTVADFNQFYGTDLQENVNLFKVAAGGISNSGKRGFVVKTNTGKEISAAYYDADTVYEDGKTETKENTGLQYKYPVNGSTQMLKIGSGTQFPGPGALEAKQVPDVPVTVVIDTVPPTLEDRTGITATDQSKGFEIKAWAEDDQQVASVTLYVKSDKQSDYIPYQLTEDYGDLHYHHTIYAADLIGRKTIEYYYIVSDGFNEVTSPKYKVDITGGPDQSDLRLNVKDGDLVSGTKTIKGTAKTGNPDSVIFEMDGQPVTTPTGTALEHDAYFVFDVKNVDYYFKNAITMGPEELKDETILYTFLDPITSYQTLSFPIEASRLKPGEDNTIYIRAGSKSGPFDDRVEENKDDFEIKNVRLVLADGTEIMDPAYAKRDVEIKMGDSAGKHEAIGFRFTLPESLFAAKSFLWDTVQESDGEHVIKAVSGGFSASAKVTVDNTPPSIAASIEDGKSHRGKFTIQAEVTDALSGVAKVETKLDGEPIRLPIETSSSQLAAGPHELYIQAADQAGNVTEKTIRFEVPAENPESPRLISPTNGQTGVGSTVDLKVNVKDPTGDRMDVSFYRGFLYDGTSKHGFTGFQNTADTEPPRELAPSGEKSLDAEDYAKIGAEDGQYLTTDSDDRFPYQRFEIKLDPSVKPSDRVDVVWKGKSLPGRKVSLYAWSEGQSKWITLKQVIAGEEDFTLKSTVKAGDYAHNGMISVMVQDEIAGAGIGEEAARTAKSGPISEDPYDFSFLWMSDTQYYSQDYPYIYRKNVQWIAENKDQLKLKYIIHTGDVVDKADQEYQWIEADQNMKVLEQANIPYGVLAGNHDVGHQDNDYSQFSKYFGDSRFQDSPVFAGSYENNRGHYDLVSANGNDFIIVYMGWGLGEKEIEWMNQVVSMYPERKAILCLHEYLLVSNNRAPIADQIFEKVVKPNKNVIAALSGHYHDAELKIDQLDDDGDGIPDRNVYQMLADYQGAPEGGLGYIRLMQFDMANNKLHIKTYSPYLDDYNFYDPQEYPGKDEFSLDLNLQAATKRVATDYIGVSVYADQLIGRQENVDSGDNASVRWAGLADDAYYQWYAKAEDANSGQTFSEIWGFHTGSASGEGNPPGTVQPGGGDSGRTPSSGGSISTPVGSPEAEQPAGNGVVTATPIGSGTYGVSAELLRKAGSGASNGKLEIQIKPGNAESGQPVTLKLDAAALREFFEEHQGSLVVRAPGSQIAFTQRSLPNQIGEADQLSITFGTGVPGNSGFEKGMSSTGIAYELGMFLIKGTESRKLSKLDAAAEIQLNLTDEQAKLLDSDYAGVYERVNGELRYAGGSFAGRTVTFTTDHPGTYEILELRKSFSDLRGHWAENIVRQLAAKHLIQGVDAERFVPAAPVTRADFALVLTRMLGGEAETADVQFADLAPDVYYTEAVKQAARLGLIQGSGGRFRPMDSITREEAAVILYKMAQVLKAEPSAMPLGNDAAFGDAGSISAWARDAVTQMQALGVLNGKGNGRFEPKGFVTRAEMAKMMSEMLKLSL